MGLDINGVRFLLRAAALGVDFHRTATIGRQGLHLGENWLEHVFKEFGHPGARQTASKLTRSHGGYADGLFEWLGAREVVAFDNSDYEGADYVHDFNQPLPADAPRGFSMVLDGGSLEHVYEYPTALRSCLSLVAQGGHFLTITPANNFAGHGFYQFSPELLFRALDSGSGFALRELLMFEASPFGRWYRLNDPKVVGKRIEFRSTVPVYLVAIARREASVLPGSHIPQQSDYADAWKSSVPGKSERRSGSPQLADRFDHRNAMVFAARVLGRRMLDSIRLPLHIEGAAQVRPQD